MRITWKKTKGWLWKAAKWMFTLIVIDTISYALVRDVRLGREITRWISYATYGVLEFLHIPVVGAPAVRPL